MRLILVALGIVLGAHAGLAARPDWDETPRIAVVSAFAPEWQAIRAAVDAEHSVDVNGTEFVTGTLGGKDVVLYMSGVSMVNAAMTTQLALDRYNITSVVFTGIAGSANPALHIGDVVVPERWGQYFEVIAARDRDGHLTIPRYFSSSHTNFGVFVPRDVDVISSTEDAPQTKFWFEVDPALFALAQKSVLDVALNNCSKGKACLTHVPEVHVGGNGVSSSVFVDNAAMREWAFTNYQAEVLDMESAAVAQVAWTNDIPFIAFRSVSDLAGGGAGQNEMGTFMDLAAENSVRVVNRFLEAMPKPMAAQPAAPAPAQTPVPAPAPAPPAPEPAAP